MQTEEFTDLLLATSRNPVIILDDSYIISKTNLKLHETFKLLEPECEGKSFYEVAKSIWKTPEMERLLTELLPLEKSVTKYQIKLAHEIEQALTISIDGRYLFDAGQNKAYIYLVLENTTAIPPEKNNVSEFNQHIEFLNSIVSSVYYGIAMYEPIHNDAGDIIDFTVLFTNAEVTSNFGLSVDQVTGKACSEVYPGIFNNGIFEKMVKCYTSGMPEIYEIQIDQKGKQIWLNGAIEPVKNMVTISSKNCTPEKEASIQLSKMNSFLSDTNRKLEQVILNEFSESFTNYKTGKSFFDFILEEIAGKTNVDIALIGEVVPDSDGESMQCLSVFIDGHISDNFTYPLRNSGCEEVAKGDLFFKAHGMRNQYPDNPTVKTHQIEGYIGYPLKDVSGECMGVICVMNRNEIHDVDYIGSLLKIAAKRCEIELDRQRHEKELEVKNAELERQNSELASFTYIASHDLQEPLRKIRMFNSRILEMDQKNLSENSLSYLNNINMTADRMQNLINALLSYSSMDSDNLRKEKTNLNGLFGDVKIMMDDILEHKKVIIHSADLPTVHVIPLQFQQLLLNILNNAIKYAKADVRPEITITAEKDVIAREKYWRLDVTDNGIGFEPQYKDRIFEVFQRLHGKKDYAGTGVGLAICAKIMNNHNGFITATGVPGVGATFSIFIPEKNKN